MQPGGRSWGRRGGAAQKKASSREGRSGAAVNAEVAAREQRHAAKGRWSAPIDDRNGSAVEGAGRGDGGASGGGAEEPRVHLHVL